MAKLNEIRAVFWSALDILSPEERRRFLNGACGDDPEFREKVDVLLRAHDEAADYLEQSASAHIDTIDIPAGEVQVGTAIGPYKLREPIGEGGMGLVYVAEQEEPVRRKVAIKIIKPGMDTKEVVARFEAERQALALMDHPNIARVLDAGATETGRPYFVMELVRGVPITEYCDKRKLTTRDRLELFAQICDGVQHAHQKGIIHRDIKPSNVIVTRYADVPVPKIIDFGVAKAINQRLTEQTVYTQMSQMVGTPLYMSPEQAELSGFDVDTRTDIYSLGVLLYELLTGTTPFTKEQLSAATYDEMRRIIREEDPPKPSDRVSTLAGEALSTVSDQRNDDPRRLAQNVRGELDWIVMTAMEKDVKRRYESAGTLAADVRHFLIDEPVSACPPTVAYRVRKFARRNKLALAIGTLASVVLIAGFVGLAVSNVLISRQRNDAQTARDGEQSQRLRAEAQRDEAEKQRKRAEENFRRAREAVDKYLTQVSENELLDVPAMQPLRKDLLELALEYYQQFIDEQADDRELQAELASAYFRVGEIRREIGGDARGAFEKAFEIRRTLAEEHPKDEGLQNALAISYHEMHYFQPTLEELFAFLRKGITTAQPLQKPEHRDTLAQTYISLGEVNRVLFEDRGDPQYRDESLKALEKATSILEMLVEEAPDVAKYQNTLAKCLDIQGLISRHIGRQDNSLAFFERALEIRKKLVEEHPKVLEYQGYLAGNYLYLGDYQKSVETAKNLFDANPMVPRFKRLLAQCYADLGEAQQDKGELSEAIASLKAAVKIRPEMSYYNELGSAQREVGRFDEAIASHERARQLAEELAPNGKGRLAEAYLGLYSTQRDAGRLDEAMLALERLIVVGKQLTDGAPDHLNYRWANATSHRRLGELHRDAGELDKALTSFRNAADVLERVFVDGESPDSPPRHVLKARQEIATDYTEIASCLEDLHRNDEAADAYGKVIEQKIEIRREFPKEKTDLGTHYERFMTLALEAEQPDKVDTFLREQLSTWQILRTQSDNQHAGLLGQLELRLQLANWFERRDRSAYAENEYRESLKIFECLVNDDHLAVDAVVTCLKSNRAIPSTETETTKAKAQFLQAVAQQQGPALELARTAVRQEPADATVWGTWNQLALGIYRDCNWKGAATEGSLAIELAADDSNLLLNIAPLLLLGGEDEEYRKMCGRLLDAPPQESEERQRKVDFSRLRLCGLDPNAARGTNRLLELAQKLSTRPGALTHELCVIGRAHYRAGECEQAVDWLQQALDGYVSHSGTTEVLIGLDMALAHYEWKHLDEARNWLEEAKRLLRERPEIKTHGSTRMEIEVLRQEAERLILDVTDSK